MVYARIAALEGYGYKVELWDGDELLEEYSAGDAFGESQVYGTGQIKGAQLREYAVMTARDMLYEHNASRNAVEYSEDLEDELRQLVEEK